jgi:hypothetical protein
MKRSSGITEPYWSSASEEFKFAWKYAYKLLYWLFAFFAVKTNNIYMDAALGLVATIFLAAVVEAQRTYGKFKPRSRRIITRTSIFLGTWCVTLLGVVIFANIAVAAVFQSIHSALGPLPVSGIAGIQMQLVLLGFAILAPKQILKVARDFQWEVMVHNMPRDALKNLLVHRRQKADTLAKFVIFEVSFMVITLVYVSAVGDLVRAVGAIASG